MLRFDGIRLLRIFTIKGQTCEAFINIHDAFERQAHGERGISGSPKIIYHARIGLARFLGQSTGIV